MMALVRQRTFHESALECTVRESAQSSRGRAVSDLTCIRSPLKISMDDVASLKNFVGFESFAGSTSFGSDEKSTSDESPCADVSEVHQAAPGELLRAAVSEEWVTNSSIDMHREPHSRCGSPSPTASSSEPIDNVLRRHRRTSSSTVEWASRFGSDWLDEVHENGSGVDPLPKIEKVNIYAMPEDFVASVVDDPLNCVSSIGDVNAYDDKEALATEMGQWTPAFATDGFPASSFSDGIVDFDWADHNYACPQSWSWNPYGDHNASYQGVTSYQNWDGHWCEQMRDQKGHRKSRAKEHRGHGAMENAELPSQPTTVILRNIPCKYNSYGFVDLLDKLGFHRLYDYIYLPISFVDGVNLGYAFVNLTTYEDALAFTEKLEGFSDWDYESDKKGEVSWAQPCQGLSAHIERYRNSPVMHPCMPDDYKPMIFVDGLRVPFPSPTKPIKTPKVRTKSALNAESGEKPRPRPGVLGGNPSAQIGASAGDLSVMSHAGCVAGLKACYEEFPPLPSTVKTT